MTHQTPLPAEPLENSTEIQMLMQFLDYMEDEWFGTRVEGHPPAAPWDQAPWSARRTRQASPA